MSSVANSLNIVSIIMNTFRLLMYLHVQIETARTARGLFKKSKIRDMNSLVSFWLKGAFKTDRAPPKNGQVVSLLANNISWLKT